MSEEYKEELKLVLSWLQANRLSLNLDKTIISWSLLPKVYINIL